MTQLASEKAMATNSVQASEFITETDSVQSECEVYVQQCTQGIVLYKSLVLLEFPAVSDHEQVECPSLKSVKYLSRLMRRVLWSFSQHF